MSLTANKIIVPANSLVAKCRAWAVLRFVLAAVILAAAGLKAHQLAVIPSLGEGLLNARWFNIFVVEFELFFGIWLIFGLLPKLTWLVTTALFSVFALVSFYKAISGETSCGCFGVVTINPWVTMAGDWAVVGMLMFARSTIPSPTLSVAFNQIFQRGAFLTFLGGWLILVTATWIGISGYSENVTVLSVDGQLASGAGVISVKPNDYLEKKLPLIPFIDNGNQFNDGLWLVLFFQHTCSACRESVDVYRGLAKEFTGKENCPQIAVVEVPSYGENYQRLFSDGVGIYSRLTDHKQWKFKTPVVLLLDQGNVKNVFENPLDTKLIRAIWGGNK